MKIMKTENFSKIPKNNNYFTGKRGFRVEQEYPNTQIFEKRKKSAKTQTLKNV